MLNPVAFCTLKKKRKRKQTLNKMYSKCFCYLLLHTKKLLKYSIVNNGMNPLVNKTPITALGARDL